MPWGFTPLLAEQWNYYEHRWTNQPQPVRVLTILPVKSSIPHATTLSDRSYQKNLESSFPQKRRTLVVPYLVLQVPGSSHSQLQSCQSAPSSYWVWRSPKASRSWRCLWLSTCSACPRSSHWEAPPPSQWPQKWKPSLPMLIERSTQRQSLDSLINNKTWRHVDASSLPSQSFTFATTERPLRPTTTEEAPSWCVARSRAKPSARSKTRHPVFGAALHAWDWLKTGQKQDIKTIQDLPTTPTKWPDPKNISHSVRPSHQTPNGRGSDGRCVAPKRKVREASGITGWKGSDWGGLGWVVHSNWSVPRTCPGSSNRRGFGTEFSAWAGINFLSNPQPLETGGFSFLQCQSVGGPPW